VGGSAVYETGAVSIPETRYARSGDVNIAYQVVGDGPLDLVLVPGFVSHLDIDWEEPRSAHALRRLASFARLIRFDKRGTGLSDRSVGLPDLETRMDDVRAVMDAVGSERAALYGYSEGGPMCCLFAATYPDRVSALVLYASYANRCDPDDDYPWAATWEERQTYAAEVERTWGDEADRERMGPDIDEALAGWYLRRARAAASPGAARDLILMNSQIDVRGILPAIAVPTLVLHRVGDGDSRWEEGRYLAERIEGAEFVLLEGNDHLPWSEPDQILDEIEGFLTGVRRGPDPDRVLATVLFTDLVRSTEKTVEVGDRQWAELIAAHHEVVRRELGRFRGHELDVAGDGFFAAFDGPARAIRCAAAVRSGLARIGLTVRAGVHTGECEQVDGKLAGLGVVIGARISGRAAGGEILVSRTVHDLVAGSGIVFEAREEAELKGVPGLWRLYAVVDA
jgi:pimeloyl-ACP methyl ester carboxylesterase